jgi:hypothetical protein
VVAGRRIGVLAVFSGRELDPVLRRTLAGLAPARRDRARGDPGGRELANDRNRVAVRSARAEGAAERAPPPGRAGSDPAPGAALRTLADLERDAIARVLEHTGGRVSGPRGAAAVLGPQAHDLVLAHEEAGSPAPDAHAVMRAVRPRR